MRVWLGENDGVKLVSADGASVDLRPVCYEYEQEPAADSAGEGEPVWDANWLVIRGQVRAADGREWTFRDPCLTTWEAERLLEWLQALGCGEVRKALAFTEPNLGFRVDAQDDERVRLRVHFSAESLPPGLRTPDARTPDARTPGRRTAGYDVPLDVGRADLADAARTWAVDCQAFPLRGPGS